MSPPLLLHVFPTFAVGGAQVRLAAIANRFGGKFRHAIVAMDGNTACRERLEPGLAVQFPAIAVRKGDTLGNLRRFRAALAGLRPDLLVTNNWGSIEWAMANAVGGVRHLHVEDGFGPEERHSQLPRRVWTRRLVLRRSTVALPSRTLWRIATGSWRLDPGRVLYVPNGIALDRFAAAAPWRWPGEGEGPVIGTVAALRAEKNIGRLLRAFARLRAVLPARLAIVGEGPERPALEALAAALGIAADVHFAGHRADPAGAYRGFDIFALSSDTEQMPLSLLEAMAASLPVAATGVGDVAEVLAEPNRRFVTPLDDAALGEALTALAADPALRATLGAANRARAEVEYDQERMFSAWDRLFAGEGAPSLPA